uniref:universal stress protein n=1 Tax=Nocardia wallacei TaxID=480035 RepID=UPI002454EAE5
MTAYRTIIVDTDGSDHSYRVVDHAAEQAHATHAPLLIISAHHPHDQPPHRVHHAPHRPHPNPQCG